MDKTYGVLIVDDDPVILHGYSKLLIAAGYHVLKASTGLDGLNLVKKERPDLILLDVVLPDVEGREVCRRIKEDPELAESFVVLLSSFKITSDDQADGLESGADGYITRPIANRELMARVQAMLRIREAQQQVKARELQQAALAELGRYALIETDLSLLEMRCLSLLAEMLRTDRCALYKPIRDRTALLLEAGMGWQDGTIGQATIDAAAHHPAALAFQAVKPIIVENIEKSGAFPIDPALTLHGIVAALGVPICRGEEAFGVLAAYATSPRVYTPNEVCFLQSLANVLAAALLRRRAEENTIRANKFQVIESLSGGLAHDFNNLLGIMLGYISLAQLSLEPDDPASSALSEVTRAIHKASELTRSFLALAGGGMPSKKVVDIKSLVMEAVEFALSGSNVQCEHCFPGDSAWSTQVKADPVLLSQALQNIVLNGVEAMPEGGPLKVTIEPATLDPVAFESMRPLEAGAYVKISIADQGKGIPQKDLTRIFDPYFSTKTRGVEKGMGLGLSVAYAILKKHDGDLLVESEEGAGTVCHIYLPAIRSEVPEAAGPLAAESTMRKGSILAMDDDDAFRKMLGQILGRLGFEAIELARDGQEAIDCFSRARQSGKPFDLVMLDLTTKGGMGGIETVKVLREIEPTVKAIICTGYSNDPVLSNFRDHGFVGALAKPYSLEELTKLLNAIGCG